MKDNIEKNNLTPELIDAFLNNDDVENLFNSLTNEQKMALADQMNYLQARKFTDKVGDKTKKELLKQNSNFREQDLASKIIEYNQLVHYIEWYSESNLSVTKSTIKEAEKLNSEIAAAVKIDYTFLNQQDSYISLSRNKIIADWQLSSYFGDAGKKVNGMLTKGKTVGQILDELDDTQKIKFQYFLQDTRQGKLLSKLSEEEIKELVDYTGGGCSIINDYLRKNSDSFSSSNKIIETIDSAIDKYGGLDEGMEIYRGLKLNGFSEASLTISSLLEGVDTKDLNQVYGVLQAVKGQTFGDLGYMSTSPSYFSSFAKNEDYNIVLDIFAKKGTKGAYIDQISGFYNYEREFLLARGTSLKIFDVLAPQKDALGHEKIIIKCIIE